MFSLADASGQRTAFVALRNCLYLVPLGYLAYDCESKYLYLFIIAAILSYSCIITWYNLKKISKLVISFVNPVISAGIILTKF